MTRFFLSCAACLFLMGLMSGCGVDGIVDTIAGSGAIVSAEDGTTTEFSIDTGLIFEEDEDGNLCTDLVQYGTATFTDCEADIEATVLLSRGDELTIKECIDLYENNEDLQEDLQFQTWAACLEEFEDNDNLNAIAYLAGRYETRSCVAEECTYYYFKYYPHSGCAYLWELDGFEDCNDEYEEGFNVWGCRGRGCRYHYYGIYVHCEGSDEVTGTGCLFAVIADEAEAGVDENGDPVDPNDKMALIMIDDDGTVAYSNCGDTGNSVVTTPVNGDDYPGGIRVCQDGVFGSGNSVIINTGATNGTIDDGEFVTLDGGGTYTITVTDGN